MKIKSISEEDLKEIAGIDSGNSLNYDSFLNYHKDKVEPLIDLNLSRIIIESGKITNYILLCTYPMYFFGGIIKTAMITYYATNIDNFKMMYDSIEKQLKKQNYILILCSSEDNFLKSVGFSPKLKEYTYHYKISQNDQPNENIKLIKQDNPFKFQEKHVEIFNIYSRELNGYPNRKTGGILRNRTHRYYLYNWEVNNKIIGYHVETPNNYILEIAALKDEYLLDAMKLRNKNLKTNEIHFFMMHNDNPIRKILGTECSKTEVEGPWKVWGKILNIIEMTKNLEKEIVNRILNSDINKKDFEISFSMIDSKETIRIKKNRKNVSFYYQEEIKNILKMKTVDMYCLYMGIERNENIGDSIQKEILRIIFPPINVCIPDLNWI